MRQTTDYQVCYPDYLLPQTSDVTLVAEGIYWLRMPLPFELNHINLYLLEDHDGWYILDTGIGDDDTRQAWEKLFKEHLGEKPVKGVIVTHMHPDHMGQAGFLTELWRAPLLMSQAEFLTARALSAPPTDASQWPVKEYYHRAGLDPAALDSAMQRESGFASIVTPLTRSYQRLQEGQLLSILGRSWRVMIGRGHSPEHVCLYCDELKLLISGDHILPAITPNISVFAAEPDANPLADYLQTLQPFTQLPAETLVLPAHNRPFTGLHKRVAYLEDHHQQKLNDLLIACQEEQTALALVPTMFKRELNAQQMMFALGECLSHLNYLCAKGKIQRRLSDKGVYLYLAQTPAPDAQAWDDDMMLEV